MQATALDLGEVDQWDQALYAFLAGRSMASQGFAAISPIRIQNL